MIELDIKRLRTLVAIARENSFTAAAERLHMSQPWVSEQIKQLEESLDLPLIERVKGKFVGLTANGHDLLPIAERIVAAWDEARRDIELLRTKEQARLTLGVDPVTLYMPERNKLIADLMATMPGLDLHIVNETPTELFEGLQSGRLDMILTLCPPPHGDFDILPLYEYQLQLFIPRAVSRRYGQSPEAMAGAQVLVLQDEYHPAFFEWLRSAFAPAGFHWVSCAETSFHALLQHAVMLGLPTLSPDFSSQIPELAQRMEAREAPMAEPVMVSWALMRRPGHRGKAAHRLWQLASRSRREKGQIASYKVV
ncbi:MAG TPA: LysR family transcriptional regulator [Novosphingobium sp.]|nr:LysR family transcriptional regulator [Novosphingobium sp.]